MVARSIQAALKVAAATAGLMVSLYVAEGLGLPFSEYFLGCFPVNAWRTKSVDFAAA